MEGGRGGGGEKQIKTLKKWLCFAVEGTSAVLDEGNLEHNMLGMGGGGGQKNQKRKIKIISVTDAVPNCRPACFDSFTEW